MNAIHLPTLTIKRISGERGDVVHFAQVIKQADGRTEYWAAKDAVEMIPDRYLPNGFDVHVRLLTLQCARRRAAEAAR